MCNATSSAAESAGVTTLHQVFNADLNPFIKLMVEKPLGNLFDHIAEKMREAHG
ncbi:MAG: hypothetical protein IPO79_06890 [Flavobacteriales bacterium]|nr:hypothetical protein [Flavobacteriales bacterium]